MLHDLEVPTPCTTIKLPSASGSSLHPPGGWARNGPLAVIMVVWSQKESQSTSSTSLQPRCLSEDKSSACSKAVCNL